MYGNSKITDKDAVVVEFDCNKLNADNFQILVNLSEILQESGELGVMELEIFKFHMMPEKKSEGYLTAPGQFQITYMYRDGANMYIPKISRCALTDMSVDFSPEGVFTTFKGDDKGAAPVLTKVELTFSEMEIMTKETIAVGH